jgi:hypothetical protein
MNAPHTFGDAYDATQCCEDIANGDSLLVLAEGVVGLAWTWPVAVTVNAGHLHSVAPGKAASIAADAGWSDEQIRAAVHIALEHGFAVSPDFANYI